MRKWTIAVTAIVMALAVSTAQGAINGVFITGHDADDHQNADYQRAGLDYLAFGHAATVLEAAQRATIKVGILYNNPGFTGFPVTGYSQTLIDIDSATWEATAFAPGAFDILMINSGLDYISLAGSTELNANAAAFAAFFNNGGGIFVHTDQGIGQSYYGFIPSFGTTTNNTIGDQGAFTATAAGNAIGLTEAIVDADITHSYYTGVDTSLFTVFETYNPTGDAVAIGLRNAIIDDDGEFGTVPEASSIIAWAGLGALGCIAARRRKQRKVA